MPLLRSRHDGNLALSAFPSLRRFQRPSLALLTFCALSSLSVNAHASKYATKTASGDEKVVGVQAWTSGRETIIRIRPNRSTPLVAKVGRHQPLYVWGKYNGWYRVETPDHIFGWIQNSYVSSPRISAVKEMSVWKMNDGSDRTGQQVMFGTTEQLKSYYTKFKAPGAAKGLGLQGIYIANGSFISKNPPVQKLVVHNTAHSENKVAMASVTTLPPVLPREAIAAHTPVSKPVVKVAAKPAKKLTWRQQRYLKRLASRSKTRQQLNQQVGLKPKPAAPPAHLQAGTIAPISPEELMRAREKFLHNRESRLPATTSPDVATMQPSSFTGTASWNELWSEVSKTGDLSEVKAADQQLAQSEALKVQVVSNAQIKPVALVASTRGGSPLDRAKAALAKGMVNQALSYRGMPYRFGAASPKRGFDCSGLIYYMLRQRGYNPPRTASGFSHYGVAVGRQSLKAGDLVLFANTYKHGVSHIGIYMGNNKFVHAASTRSGIRVDSLTGGYFAKKYYGARRINVRS